MLEFNEGVKSLEEQRKNTTSGLEGIIGKLSQLEKEGKKDSAQYRLYLDNKSTYEKELEQIERGIQALQRQRIRF